MNSEFQQLRVYSGSQLTRNRFEIQVRTKMQNPILRELREKDWRRSMKNEIRKKKIKIEVYKGRMKREEERQRKGESIRNEGRRMEEKERLGWEKKDG